MPSATPRCETSKTAAAEFDAVVRETLRFDFFWPAPFVAGASQSATFAMRLPGAQAVKRSTANVRCGCRMGRGLIPNSRCHACSAIYREHLGRRSPTAEAPLDSANGVGSATAGRTFHGDAIFLRLNERRSGRKALIHRAAFVSLTVWLPGRVQCERLSAVVDREAKPIAQPKRVGNSMTSAMRMAGSTNSGLGCKSERRTQ